MTCDICGRRTTNAVRVGDKVECDRCRAARRPGGSALPLNGFVQKVNHASRKACADCARELRTAQLRGLKKAEALLCGGCRKTRAARLRLAGKGSS